MMATTSADERSSACPHNTILHGDALDVLRSLPDGCVQAVVTSPPYWAQRDYGMAGQIGLEASPAAYVARLVDVFAEARRVLRADGTLWLTIGDTYNQDSPIRARSVERMGNAPIRLRRSYKSGGGGCKRKDLIGVPWLLAAAMRSDGWYVRAECIWHKPYRPEGRLSDRPDRTHETIFLFTKRPNRYRIDRGRMARWGSVWRLDVAHTGHHAAMFSAALAERCVLVSTIAGDLVLDPFMGSGTVGVVARRHCRDYLGIELNLATLSWAQRRIAAERQPHLWTSGPLT